MPSRSEATALIFFILYPLGVNFKLNYIIYQIIFFKLIIIWYTSINSYIKGIFLDINKRLALLR
ncbi:hypothetical protein, partial [Borreliella garinii]|uniref:hypothetical protein n=1 Tax=Borreliella garinii TaxID=29519 RepID=UPI001AF02514